MTKATAKRVTQSGSTGTNYDFTAQNFVDALNEKEMPLFGFVHRNNRWEFSNVFSGYWEYRRPRDEREPCEDIISTGERLDKTYNSFVNNLDEWRRG